jgi:hypothetical protein
MSNMCDNGVVPAGADLRDMYFEIFCVDLDAKVGRKEAKNLRWRNMNTLLVR